MKGEIPDNVKIEAYNDILLNIVSVCKWLLYIVIYSLRAAVPREGIQRHCHKKVIRICCS